MSSQFVWQKILNITPDSFSDGGNVFGVKALEESFSTAYNRGVRCFDFGAQSTAPNARFISLDEEKARYKEYFLPFIKSISITHDLADCIFSFDTFRPDTISFVAEIMRDNKVGLKGFFWNDVSGVLDEHSINFLKSGPQRKLILCHNLAQSREDSANHDHFKVDIFGLEFIHYLAQYFKNHLDLVPDEFMRQIVIDPCFGFSKHNCQNVSILENFRLFESMFCEGTEFLIGISRKRFLRSLSGFNLDNLSALDDFQDSVLEKLKKTSTGTCYYIRAHRCSLGKI